MHEFSSIESFRGTQKEWVVEISPVKKICIYLSTLTDINLGYYDNVNIRQKTLKTANSIIPTGNTDLLSMSKG